MSGFALLAPFAAWSGPLTDAPDEAFAGGLLGDGLVLDPLEGVVRAPFDGTVVAVAPTGHAITLRHASGAEILIHIGIDTVALAGRGFASLTAPDAVVRLGDELLRFDMDVVARGAKSLISPLVLLDEGHCLDEIVSGRQVASGECIAMVRPRAGMAGPTIAPGSGSQLSRELRVPFAHGLHARPSARIAAVLKPFAAEVSIVLAGRRANARSLTALLKLGVGKDDSVRIEASGTDAGAALEAVAAFLLSGIEEPDSGSDAPALPVAATSLKPGEAGIAGIRAAPGGAMGTAFRLALEDVGIPDGAGSPAEEQAALFGAVTALEARLTDRSRDHAIAAAHLELLADPDLRAVVLAHIDAGHSAAAAWRAATRVEVAALAASGNPLLAERCADLIDVERQLLGLLLNQPEVHAALPDCAILIADELLPSAFFTLDIRRIAGIVTARGGPTSHAAILAAAKGVPMLVGCGAGVLDIADATPLIIDIDRPVLHVRPDGAMVDAFAERAAHMRATSERQQIAARQECRTADGLRIEVFANCGSAADASDAVTHGAEGCGLLRSEFLFLGRNEPPSVEEQAAAYAGIASALDGRPLIVRTLDAGSDKPLAYLPARTEANPALGLRGIRLLLASPHLLEDQFAAILASVPVAQRRIMLPMVCDLGELRAAKALLRKVEEGLGIDEPTPLGVMVETPAAALLSDQLAREADFLSIGSNDLAQYALAADRQDPDLARTADALHPAVLRLIAMAAEGACANDRWLGLCGTIASDPIAAPLLVGLGVTELSVSPRMVPAVKAAVRAIGSEDARALAQEALRQESAADVRRLIEARQMKDRPDAPAD